MYRTIEAIYDNGKVYPAEDIKIKKGSVLLTILEEEHKTFDVPESFFTPIESLHN